VKIGLLWHSLRHPNLGVDALTRANLSIIETAARGAGVNPHYILLGHVFAPGRDSAFPEVEIGCAPSLKNLIRRRSQFWSDVGSCDVIFDIGEGDSFADIYGVRRYLQQLISKIVVLTHGVPLVLSPQTIGPFSLPWTRFLAVRVMKACRRVFARDYLSAMELTRLHITHNVAEFTDVAFRLPFDRPQRPEGSNIRVGINVSALLYHRGYTGKNELGLTLDYATLIKRLIEAFSVRDNIELIFVPHVLDLELSNQSKIPRRSEHTLDASASEDDHVVSRCLASMYPVVTVAPKFTTSTQAKSFIAGLDFLVAGRMHACIGALSSGVPVVPISYSRKFTGLFGGLGYEWYVDARKESTECAVEFVLRAFDQREVIKLEAQRSAAKSLALLEAYEKAIAELLKQLGQT
jgi:colanic acid/amylovoran biosynthesis protein